MAVMKTIRTAVIPVGGLGTRFYPLSKTLNKCLLPVYNRPLVDYIIDNLVTAGLSRVVFISREQDVQLERYLSEDLELRSTLSEVGKSHIYDSKIRPIHERIQTVVVHQPAHTQRGTAAALVWAREYVSPGEPFVVTMGDHFLWRAGEKSDLREMIESYEATGASAACMVEQVKTFSEIANNAAVLTKTGPKGELLLRDIIEKPETDPGVRLSNVGQYIFDDAVFRIIKQQPADARSGEYGLPDTLKIMSRHVPVLVHPIVGREIDCGTPQDWLAANNFAAKHIIPLAVLH
jgi:UTP--glucose-1-phosphate uridylyltransferase